MADKKFDLILKSRVRVDHGGKIDLGSVIYLTKKMNEMMLGGVSRLVLILLLLLQGLGGDGSDFGGDGGNFGGDYSKLSGIIIPGFASTQLRAWSILDCPYSPLDFNPLDLVWLDTTKVSLSLYLSIF